MEHIRKWVMVATGAGNGHVIYWAIESPLTHT